MDFANLDDDRMLSNTEILLRPCGEWSLSNILLCIFVSKKYAVNMKMYMYNLFNLLLFSISFQLRSVKVTLSHPLHYSPMSMSN